jgi:predicted membrane metal-binding protein
LFPVSAFTPLNWFFWALAVAALIVEVWAFVDAVRRPTAAFPAAGKQTKPLWLIILGVAAAIGLYSATGAAGIGVVVSILPVAAFIAAAIYLTDVRPKVREIGRGGSSQHGPYGPW